MEETLRIAVFGDSLMKGTLPDEQLRYHFHTDLFEAPLAGLHAEVTNKSVFGATSRKGVTLVQRDLAAATAMTGHSWNTAATTATITGPTWPRTRSRTTTPWCWRTNSART